MLGLNALPSLLVIAAKHLKELFKYKKRERRQDCHEMLSENSAPDNPMEIFKINKHNILSYQHNRSGLCRVFSFHKGVAMDRVIIVGEKDIKK